MRWVQIDGIWHLIGGTGMTEMGPDVVTVCGVKRSWDGTGLDALPGGDEVACEDCTSDPVVAPPVKPKRTRKTK